MPRAHSTDAIDLASRSHQACPVCLTTLGHRVRYTLLRPDTSPAANLAPCCLKPHLYARAKSPYNTSKRDNPRAKPPITPAYTVH